MSFTENEVLTVPQVDLRWSGHHRSTSDFQMWANSLGTLMFLPRRPQPLAKPNNSIL